MSSPFIHTDILSLSLDHKEAQVIKIEMILTQKNTAKDKKELPKLSNA